jgi:hypothetical protein
LVVHWGDRKAVKRVEQMGMMMVGKKADMLGVLKVLLMVA